MKKPIMQKRTFESYEAFYATLYRTLTADEWNVAFPEGRTLLASRIKNGKETRVIVTYLREQRQFKIYRRQAGEREQNATYYQTESAVVGWTIPYDRMLARVYALEGKVSKAKPKSGKRCRKHFWEVKEQRNSGKDLLECIFCKKRIERSRYKINKDGELVKTHRPVLVRSFRFTDDGMVVSYRLVPIRGKKNKYHIKPSFPLNARITYKKITCKSFSLAKGIATNWLKHKLGLEPIGEWAEEKKEQSND